VKQFEAKFEGTFEDQNYQLQEWHTICAYIKHVLNNQPFPTFHPYLDPLISPTNFLRYPLLPETKLNFGSEENRFFKTTARLQDVEARTLRFRRDPQNNALSSLKIQASAQTMSLLVVGDKVIVKDKALKFNEGYLLGTIKKTYKGKDITQGMWKFKLIIYLTIV
jgi:hypothetical protein